MYDIGHKYRFFFKEISYFIHQECIAFIYCYLYFN